MKHEIPDGEEKVRAICTVCGRIAYENPKMVSPVMYQSILCNWILRAWMHALIHHFPMLS